jgi:hypothetical protein
MVHRSSRQAVVLCMNSEALGELPESYSKLKAAALTLIPKLDFELDTSLRAGPQFSSKQLRRPDSTQPEYGRTGFNGCSNFLDNQRLLCFN